MTDYDIALICETVICLSLIGAGTYVVHRLSERLRVAAPPKPAAKEEGK